MPKHAFQFTLWSEEPDFLDMWLDHFERKRIPAAIVCRPNGSSLEYSVWRAGRPVGAYQPEDVIWSGHYRIVEEVYDFHKIVGGHDE